jgi:hypothetical protein
VIQNPLGDEHIVVFVVVTDTHVLDEISDKEPEGPQHDRHGESNGPVRPVPNRVGEELATLLSWPRG